MEKENSSIRHGKKGCFKLFGVEISTNISDEEERSRKRSTTEDLELPIKLNNDNAGNVIQSSTTHETESHDQKQQQKKKKKENDNACSQWSKQEHERFLIGLREKGSGNWKEIASEFVKTRTKTQVASHAQKYFLRQINKARRQETNFRKSIFDMSLQPTLAPDGLVDGGWEQPASASPTGMPMKINTINASNCHAADNHHHHQYMVVRGFNNIQQQQQPSTDCSSRILQHKFCLLPQNMVGPHNYVPGMSNPPYGLMMILPAAAAAPPYSDL